MKKALSNVGLTGPSKLVRRVLSKTSNVSKASNVSEKARQFVNNSPMDLETELNSLKEQISKLQITVNSMQNDSEKKEQAIANLAREKEKLATDLRKEKRSNINLLQQLEDEREFYYREKQVYCKEINECKKIKSKIKQFTKDENNTQNQEVVKYQKEIAKLKEALNQTLEANYNLSVKFLRMKNTKYCLKNRMKKLQTDYGKLRRDCEQIIEQLKREIKDMCTDQFKLPIPPSNRKHIQVIKENASLLHDNLCLHLELDKMNLEIERLKMADVRKETNKKLKYINSKTSQSAKKPSHVKGAAQRVSETPICAPLREVEAKLDAEEVPIINLFERSHHISRANDTKPSIYLNKKPPISDTSNTKFDMIQISENGSKTSSLSDEMSNNLTEAVRTQSAPEITQSVYLFNNS